MPNLSLEAINPLKEEDLGKINQQLENLEVAQAQIELAAQAGFDVDDRRTRLSETRDRLQRIKQTYFPGR